MEIKPQGSEVFVVRWATDKLRCLVPRRRDRDNGVHHRERRR